MPGRVIKLVLAVVLAAGVVAATAGSALADDPPVGCTQTQVDQGICVITDPGDGGGGGGDQGGGGGSTGAGCVDGAGADIPCSTGAGTWSSDRGCYVAAASPQPPDVVAAGGRPGDTLYNCTTTAGAKTTFWSATPPGDIAGLLNPVDLARQAIATMNLHVFDVGIVPEEGGTGYVGLPVWMWAANPGASTTGPNQAAVGGVTAKATMTTADWNMGDDHVVTCDGPGTAYEDRFGNTMSPDCGYRYNEASSQEAAGVYAVTVTTKWQVAWNGLGQSGVINLTFTGPVTQVRIAELQAVGQ